ncbi:hypothetical protein ABGB18_41360 [Nonomuraea sp. B12E4]
MNGWTGWTGWIVMGVFVTFLALTGRLRWAADTGSQTARRP